MSRIALSLMVASILPGVLFSSRDRLQAPDWSLEHVGEVLEVPAPPPPSTQALYELRRSLKLEPSNPYRWMDLGEAYASRREMGEARLCFETAARVGPNLSTVLLRSAAFHARMRDFRATLPFLKALIDRDPGARGAVFDFYHRHNLLNPAHLEDGLPVQAASGEAYFRYVLEKPPYANDPQAMLRWVDGTWRWLVAHSLSSAPLADAYVRFLLQYERFREARAVWTAQSPPAPENANNLLSNSGFESEPHDWAFDWKISPCDHVEVSRDSASVHSGLEALEIRFDGLDNVSFSHVSQNVVVSAGQYCFSTWARSEGITTDQGITFRIFDERNPERFNLFVPQVRGTTPWHEVRDCFRIPAGTHLVSIVVARSISSDELNRIAGTVWLDDLRLEPAGRSEAAVEARSRQP